MKRILIFLSILILFTSCSTQRQVIYRDCNCDNYVPYSNWGWNNSFMWNSPFMWNNSFMWNSPFMMNPYLGWNIYRPIPRYYTPQIIRPAQPTRYNRRSVIQPQQRRTVQPRQRQSTAYPRVRENTQPQRSNRIQPTNRIIQQNTPPTRSTPRMQPTNVQPRSVPQRSAPPSRGNYTPTRGGRGN